MLLACALLGFGIQPLSADQKGAEAVKKPVKVAIVDARKIPDWAGDPVGNVEVTYADKTTDHWTRLATAMMPRIGPDGLVGWVDATEQKEGSTKLAQNDRGTPVGSRLFLCSRGKVIAKIKAGLPFIEEWAFDPDGKHVVVKSRAAHGPATIQRFLSADGSAAGETNAYNEKAPAWAKPFLEL